MPKSFPLEFRRDAVAVAVARKGVRHIAQVAKDFGVSEACLHRWIRLSVVEDGARPGPTRAEPAELREGERRHRLIEQENEVLRRAAAVLFRDLDPR